MHSLTIPKKHRLPVLMTGLTVILIAAGITGLILQPSSQPEPQPAPTTTVSQTQPDIPKPSAPAPDKANVASGSKTEVPYTTPKSLGDKPFASSLRGTDIDGQLAADANGQLVVNQATRDFFDYFLNAIGESSPEEALAQIKSLTRRSLPPAAADQAMALLDRYLDYKRQAIDLGSRPLDPSRQQDPAYQMQMFHQALQDLKQLRNEMFSPATHEAFFGPEEAYDDYTLASIDIQRRTDLSESAKRTLLEWQRQQLPPQIRKTEQRLVSEQKTQQQRQAAMAAANSPEDAGERLIASGMDPGQAGEVVNYLRDRQQFAHRYDQFKTELNQLRDAGLAPSDLKQRQSQLLASYFDTEQTRSWARLRMLSPDSQAPTQSGQ